MLYNARGFRSGFTFVKELLHDCDILCLQEQWLLNEQLNDFNIVFGVSRMDSEM